MTAELLVLQFIDDGKLTVEDAVQLLETLKTEDEQDDVWDDSHTLLTVWIVQK